MENLVGVAALLFWAFLIGYLIFLFVKNRKYSVPYDDANVTHSNSSSLFDDTTQNTMGDISLSNSWNIGKTD